MFRSSSIAQKPTKLQTYSDDEFDLEEADFDFGLHPLDTYSSLYRIINDMFFVWAWQVMKVGNLTYEKIPPVPSEMRSKVMFQHWQSIYNQRKHRNLGTNTLQMIWHTQKWQMMRLFIYQLLAYSLILVAFLVVRNNLWTELGKISKHNSNAFNMFKYALLIFVIFHISRFLQVYGSLKGNCLSIYVKSNLLLSLYNKTLSLDISECDKQSVLNLIGSDIEIVKNAVYNILFFCPPLIAFLLLLVQLYFIVGTAAIFGIIFLLVIGFPVQLWFGLKMFKYTRLRMNFADQRVQLITEAIRGIRVLKVNCYELPLMEQISELRKHELRAIKKRNDYLSILVLSLFTIPTLMLIITLFFHIFVFDHEFDSDITVFTLMLFSIIQIIVKAIPTLLNSLATISTSSERLDAFHRKQSVELAETDNGIDDFDKTTAIEITDGTFEWNASMSDGFRLSNISLNIKRGKLIAIIGSVGCGKSSLLQAILREMKCVSGELKVNLSEIVYCSQIPYIRNLTLRENIILELPFDETVYKKCIIYSALLSDLPTLENSDLTIIGDEGVNLSGGQKMRVAFARTLYRHGMLQNDSNHIFIFDDPLSCVDIYVGRHMFLEGIRKYLMGNNNITCIVVLNSHLHLLKYFDEIVIMDRGQIGVHSSVNDLFYSQQKSTYSILLKYQHLLPNIISARINDIENIEEDRKDFDEATSIECDFDLQSEESFRHLYLNPEIEIPTVKLLLNFCRLSLKKFDYKSHWFPNAEQSEIVKTNEISKKNTGLFKLLGPGIVSMIIVCCTPICDLWLLYWSQQIEYEDEHTMKVMNPWYLSAWFVMLSIVAFGTVYTMRSFTDIALKSAKYIHSKSLFNILRANVLFYDLTPRGDIINRFSFDTNIMDIEFVQGTYTFLIFAASTVGYLLLILLFIPLSIIPSIFIFPIFAYLHYKFEPCFFRCNEWMKQRQSFVTSLFSETVVNLDTIRSYKLQSYFMHDLKARVDNVSKCYFMSRYLSRGENFFQNVFINVLQFSVTMISIYQIQLSYATNRKQFVILALWYFVSIQFLIFTVAYQYVLVKADFTSIMRLMHYHSVFDHNLKCGNEMIHEPKPINIGYQIQNQNKPWPSEGNIAVSKLQLKYRKRFTNLQLDIESEIKIKMGDKIGICGRTGSGKSSILTSLFRLFEPSANDAVIDGLSLAQLGLYDLRSNLSIVSQDPVLFSGNLRFNLDPFHRYSDNEIWTALTNVQCAGLIHNREGRLHCTVEENGSNFSVGERQLLCFARSLLLKSPVWFLDEPTSSIDKNTDNIIQKLIRSPEFEKVTVICIAHRLQTIIDYDYILLLKNGKIKEYDTPQNLLRDKNGDFYKLVQTDKLYYRM